MFHFVDNDVATVWSDGMWLRLDELTNKQFSALLKGKPYNPTLLVLDIREGVSGHEKAEMVEAGLATAEDVRNIFSAAPDLDFAMKYFAACIESADHYEKFRNSLDD